MAVTLPAPNVPEPSMPWARAINDMLRHLQAATEQHATNAAAVNLAAVATTAATGAAARVAGEARTTADSATATAEVAYLDAQAALEKVETAIATSLDEYVVTNSSSVVPAPEAGWSSDTPDWGDGQFVWRRTKNTRIDGTISYTSPAVITGSDGKTGEDAVLLRVASSRGTSFKNNAIATVLTVTVFKGTRRITTIEDLQAEFGLGAYLEWWWRRMDDAGFGVISSADNRLSQSGFALTVSPLDVDEQSVFECRLQTSN